MGELDAPSVLQWIQDLTVRAAIYELALKECAELAGAEVGDDDDWRVLTNKATFVVDAVGQLRADYEEVKHG